MAPAQANRVDATITSCPSGTIKTHGSPTHDANEDDANRVQRNARARQSRKAAIAIAIAIAPTAAALPHKRFARLECAYVHVCYSGALDIRHAVSS